MHEVKDSDLVNFEDDDFDTILERDITFKGRIRFKKPFMIRGTVSGSITATSDLVLDTSAQVMAEISAARVVVRGTVEGNITAERIVVVTSTGSVQGDITARQVVLEQGSRFIGRCSMPEETA